MKGRVVDQRPLQNCDMVKSISFDLSLTPK